MNIQPVNQISLITFGKEKRTDKGNTYNTTNSGKLYGFLGGVAIGSILLATQMRSLKTFSGKRELLEGYHMRGKKLNDIMPFKITRNTEGKIIPPEGGVSERTKKVVKTFKNSLIRFGVGITAITTLVGGVSDKNTNLERMINADKNPIIG